MFQGKRIEEKKENGLVINPIFFPPPIKSNLAFSIISAIMAAKEPDFSWFYNNFIQIYKKNFTQKLDYYPNADFALSDKSYLSISEFNQQNYRLNTHTIINDIQFWINNDNYVVMHLDEFYLPGTRFYWKHHFIHSQFIYGFDLNKEIFYVLNFNGENDIALIKINFFDIVNSIDKTIENNKINMDNEKLTMRQRNKLFRIEVINYNKYLDDSYDNSININSIKYKLKEYLSSSNSSTSSNYFTSNQKGTWGIHIYKFLISMLNDFDEPYLDYRNFFFLYEHKCLMQERLIKLHEMKLIDDYSKEMEEIVIICEKIKNTVFKYNLIKEKKHLRNIIDFLYEVEKKEKKLLDLCVDSLK